MISFRYLYKLVHGNGFISILSLHYIGALGITIHHLISIILSN